MSKYIKLDTAIEHTNELYHGDEVEAWLESLPTIDIVHCVDCKFKRLYDGETKYYYCALEDRPNRNWSVDEWNFCWWGERIDNE